MSLHLWSTDQAQGIDGLALLLAGRWVAGALVGVLAGGEEVVAVDVAAAGCGDAVDPLGLLVGARRQIGLEREDVAFAVVGVLGRHVGVAGIRVAGVGLRVLGDAAQIVVGQLLFDAARVERVVHPAGAVVGHVQAQDGIRARIRGAWTGIRGAAVGANI